MDFYTLVLRQSAGYWVALCLENGIVGQGDTQDTAIQKLKEAIDSVQMVYETDKDADSETVSIKALHEFLNIGSQKPTLETYELRAVYA
ncbi:MAG: type II toxin-antitoxin system HicB family antitoxin [Leptolyngbyaceae cyanobacterium CAN_BIN12]|nr:type II toxin-antitoxin system HicB family antitoxin [Leptolyngbyaceae cyanobacterium CAN_BIN12]